jgi:hypothetical protein
LSGSAISLVFMMRAHSDRFCDLALDILNQAASIFNMKQLFLFLVCFFALMASLNFVFCETAFALVEPDWSEGFVVPAGGRSNPYQLSAQEFEASRERGRLHALVYPVAVTGMLPPYRPVLNFLESQNPNPLYNLLQNLFRSFTEIKNFNSLLEWVGLHEYPKEDAIGIYKVPYPEGKRPNYYMGLSLIEKNHTTGFTLSCAACHSASLFGKSILGLTNRFPRANRLFFKAKQASAFADINIFQISTAADPSDTALMSETLENLKSVTTKLPQQLGLDTSLSQVSLSLNRRALGPWAEKDLFSQNHPRPDALDNDIADSKPAVWWNLKYKNRWLSDGSVVSGNPVFTNLLWNEIGRGVDLQVLDQWFKENSQVVQDLVTAVFSSEAPAITDFFDINAIDLGSAKRGETLYIQSCQKCHGEYLKDWDSAQAASIENIKTVQVFYRNKTAVVDVQTDPHRARGMKSLEKLNQLEISKNNKTLIRAQNAYVPPPLVGIWARWPYFHNNSIPSLCALLSTEKKRPRKYFAREALDQQKDFDLNCNGYPEKSEGTGSIEFDTSREGLSNLGHDQGILSDGEVERFSPQDKKDLISFLQTL